MNHRYFAKLTIYTRLIDASGGRLVQEICYSLLENFLPREYSYEAPGGIIIGSILGYFYHRRLKMQDNEYAGIRKDYMRHPGSQKGNHCSHIPLTPVITDKNRHQRAAPLDGGKISGTAGITYLTVNKHKKGGWEVNSRTVVNGLIRPAFPHSLQGLLWQRTTVPECG